LRGSEIYNMTWNKTSETARGFGSGSIPDLRLGRELLGEMWPGRIVTSR
jgi:hypothetical protein